MSRPETERTSSGHLTRSKKEHGHTLRRSCLGPEVFRIGTSNGSSRRNRHPRCNGLLPIKGWLQTDNVSYFPRHAPSQECKTSDCPREVPITISGSVPLMYRSQSACIGLQAPTEPGQLREALWRAAHCSITVPPCHRTDEAQHSSSDHNKQTRGRFVVNIIVIIFIIFNKIPLSPTTMQGRCNGLHGRLPHASAPAEDVVVIAP